MVGSLLGVHEFAAGFVTLHGLIVVMVDELLVTRINHVASLICMSQAFVSECCIMMP